MTTVSPGARREPTAGRWWGLTVVCVGTMMTFLNVTQIVSTLGPIQRDLGASSAQLVWIASAYAMAVASLVLSTGTLGDRFGRRQIFALGVAILGAGSLVTALAESPAVVIAGQAFAGLGGAMVIPNGLAIISHTFEDPHERSSAVGVWATVSGVGLALGPLCAGGLLEAFSWHSVFVVNIAVAVAVLSLTWRLVPDSRQPARKLDPFGLVLAIIAVGALNYGVIQGGNEGFGDTKIVVAFAVTVAAVAGFIVAELRIPAPMLRLTLFTSRSFSVANLAAFVTQYAFVGVAIAQVLWLEQVRGDSILSTGLLILPLMGAYVVTSTPAGRLARRLGFKATIAGGLVLLAGATLWMTRQAPGTSSLDTALLLAVAGIGCGLALPSSVAAAVISVPHHEGGMASGSISLARQLGSALGASITGTIITTGIASRLPGQLAAHGVPAGARPGIVHAVAAGQSASSAPAALRSAIESSAGSSFAGALHVAMLTFGFGAAALAVATVALLANRPQNAADPAPAAAPAPEPEPEYPASYHRAPAAPALAAAHPNARIRSGRAPGSGPASRRPRVRR